MGGRGWLGGACACERSCEPGSPKVRAAPTEVPRAARCLWVCQPAMRASCKLGGGCASLVGGPGRTTRAEKRTDHPTWRGGASVLGRGHEQNTEDGGDEQNAVAPGSWPRLLGKMPSSRVLTADPIPFHLDAGASDGLFRCALEWILPSAANIAMGPQSIKSTRSTMHDTRRRGRRSAPASWASRRAAGWPHKVLLGRRAVADGARVIESLDSRPADAPGCPVQPPPLPGRACLGPPVSPSRADKSSQPPPAGPPASSAPWFQSARPTGWDWLRPGTPFLTSLPLLRGPPAGQEIPRPAFAPCFPAAAPEAHMGEGRRGLAAKSIVAHCSHPWQRRPTLPAGRPSVLGAAAGWPKMRP